MDFPDVSNSLKAVILLDELEKAHKVCVYNFCMRYRLTSDQDVSMILLQILDEGSITDSHGRKVDFKVFHGDVGLIVTDRV